MPHRDVVFESATSIFDGSAPVDRVTACIKEAWTARSSKIESYIPGQSIVETMHTTICLGRVGEDEGLPLGCLVGSMDGCDEGRLLG
jgi:hypothetical protein